MNLQRGELKRQQLEQKLRQQEQEYHRNPEYLGSPNW